MYSINRCRNATYLCGHLPVRAGKLPRIMGGGIGPRTETCVNWGGPITMVPCLHQRNTYLQWNIRVWGEQKCIALVSGEPPPACASRETTLSQRGLYWAENRNLRKLGWNYCLGTVFPQRQCLYQKEAACMETTIPLVGAETLLTCVGWQTTPSHGGGIGPRTKTCVNFCGPIAMVPLFAPRQCLYQKEDTGMERTEMYSTSWCRNPTYLYCPAN